MGVGFVTKNQKRTLELIYRTENSAIMWHKVLALLCLAGTAFALLQILQFKILP